jgi:tetratricopeptide (TPR) repeat protein
VFYTFASFLFLFILTPPLTAQNSGASPLSNDPVQNYRTGRELEGQGRMTDATVYYNEAIRQAQEAISGRRANIDSYAALTWALRRQNRHSDVVRYGQEGLNLRADDARIIETMGESYFFLGNYAQSLRFMERYLLALPAGDMSALAYFYIGEIYRIQSKWRHADIAYTAALKLSGGWMALWWYRLGAVRESAGEYGSAAQAYEEALKRDSAYRQAREGMERSRRLAG